ncbi:beta-1,6-N-acetylglucosaminyltransferase [Dyadobacter flavalbus]|uniref:Peptide O-xylosyltransferase n=1 Tax=Dyadobacter flavalbus TaxID=2579942 RepID=A0A5M8QS57_9BACT|nr:beta-1,6-N-acetylglucosaminyltransferase [Dyadobacter flavalbus]KAA6438909.1 beta-1,6-N-acetylglucosaminyltransferase [Dyadobacter flavalbus]
MDITYLILAHNKLHQVDRLIGNLLGNDVYIYIHIDKRVHSSEIKQYNFASHKRVKVIRNRVAVSWGGFSMVQATLNLMKAACTHHQEGYCVLLSGQDFPLQPVHHINAFLNENYGKEFLQYWQLPYKNWINGGLDRIKYYWFVDKIGMDESNVFFNFQRENKMERSYFKDYPPYGGSQWWCLTTSCVRYILDFIKQNPIVVEYFELTLIPDESFFKTIVLNSPFKENVVNDNLKYIVFEGGKPHPNLMRLDDFDSLVNSKKLWGRKFDMAYDNQILDKIENQILLA